MGSFMGHIIPGTIFLIGGIIWLFSICHKYYSSFSKGKPPYKSRMLIAHFGSERLNNLPLETVILFSLVSVGLVGEVVTGFGPDGFYMGNAQHITMFSYFLISTLLSTALLKKYIVMPNLDYFSFAMASFGEGLLFMYHLHGRDNVDVLIHTLLLYVIAGCFFSTILEGCFPHVPLFALMRSFFFTWQGTWFYQVAFMLYSPFVKESPWLVGDHHRNIMMATVIFVWHGIFVFILQAMVLITLGKVYAIKNKVPLAYMTNGLGGNISMSQYAPVTTNSKDSDRVPMLTMELSDSELNLE